MSSIHAKKNRTNFNEKFAPGKEKCKKNFVLHEAEVSFKM